MKRAFAVTFVAAVAAASATTSSLPAQDTTVVSRLASWKSLDGSWVVRCDNNKITTFSKLGIKDIDGQTVTFKKYFFGKVVSADTALDGAQKQLLADLLLISGHYGVQTKVGLLEVAGTSVKETPTCAVQEILRAPNSKADFEPAYDYSKVDMFGKPVASVTYEEAKPKQKSRTPVCVIHKAPAHAAFPPLADDLQNAFYDELLIHLQKNHGTVSFDAAPPNTDGGHDLVFDVLTLAVTPSGLKNKPPLEEADVVFRVIDRATGKLLWRARGQRPIGKERDKDIRSFTDLIGC